MLLVVALSLSACGARFDRPATDALGPQQGTTQDGLTAAEGGTSGATTSGTGTSGTAPVAGGTTGSVFTGTSGTSGGTGGGTSGSGGSVGGTTGGGSSGSSGSSTTGSTPTRVPAGSTVGVTDDLVKIAILVPKTGAAPVPRSIDAQAKTYADFLNSKGGVFGRKLQLTIFDTQSTEAGARAAVDQIRDQGYFAAVTLDRIAVEGALVQALGKAGIPHLANQVPPAIALPADAFVIGTDQTVTGRQIARYMKNTLKVRRVGIVTETDPTAYPAADAWRDEARKLGLEIVHDERINGMDSQFLAEAQKLANDKAESVWLYVAPTPAINIAQSAKQNGYSPPWISSSIAWGFNLVLAPGQGAFDKAVAFSPWGGLADPRYALYNATNKSNDAGAADKDIGLPAWGYGQIVAAAMKAAGPDLGRNSFRHAMQNLVLNRTDVVTGAPLCWSPLDFRGGKRFGSGGQTITMTVSTIDGVPAWKTATDYSNNY